MSALSAFLDRCFLKAITKQDREAMQVKVKAIMDFHKQQGTLQTHNWSKEPIPEIVKTAVKEPLPVPGLRSTSESLQPLKKPSPVPSTPSNPLASSGFFTEPTDARTRLLARISQKKQSTPSFRPPQSSPPMETALDHEPMSTIIPKCTSPCPKSELDSRCLDSRIDFFEQVDNNLILIKSFRRSAAGIAILPEDIRTPQALLFSIQYLTQIFKQFYNNEGFLLDLFAFVANRIRAIHQDISVQDLNAEVEIFIKILEGNIKLLILFDFLLFGYEISQYNYKLNLEQISKMLTTLLQCYLIAKSQGISCIFEPLFRSFEPLIGLNTTFKKSIPLEIGQVSINGWIKNIRKESINDFYKSTINLLFDLFQNNWIEFFKSYSNLPNTSVLLTILLQRPARFIQHSSIILLKKTIKDTQIDRSKIEITSRHLLIDPSEMIEKLSSEEIPIEEKQWDFLRELILNSTLDLKNIR
ncbi:hypothetical protein RCL1_001616 [Eukaryota sp. TZLM3-RCL]